MRVRESLQDLYDKAKICDLCRVGKTWEPKCRNCGLRMCEVCFQYSPTKCCKDYYVPNRDGSRRVPQLPRAIR